MSRKRCASGWWKHKHRMRNGLGCQGLRLGTNRWPCRVPWFMSSRTWCGGAGLPPYITIPCFPPKKTAAPKRDSRCRHHFTELYGHIPVFLRDRSRMYPIWPSFLAGMRHQTELPTRPRQTFLHSWHKIAAPDGNVKWYKNAASRCQRDGFLYYIVGPNPSVNAP